MSQQPNKHCCNPFRQAFIICGIGATVTMAALACDGNPTNSLDRAPPLEERYVKLPQEQLNQAVATVALEERVSLLEDEVKSLKENLKLYMDEAQRTNARSSRIEYRLDRRRRHNRTKESTNVEKD